MAAARPIFVITGQLSAGKSTIASALLARFDRGLHVDVDAIREMVVSGRASPLDWNDETERQFGLAVEGSVALAGIYSRAGYAVVIEGGLDPAAARRALLDQGLADRLVGVVLHPRLDVALARNRARTHKGFDTSVLEDAMRHIDDDLRREPPPEGWSTLDNSDEPMEQTVERILSIAR